MGKHTHSGGPSDVARISLPHSILGLKVAGYRFLAFQLLTFSVQLLTFNRQDAQAARHRREGEKRASVLSRLSITLASTCEYENQEQSKCLHAIIRPVQSRQPDGSAEQRGMRRIRSNRFHKYGDAFHYWLLVIGVIGN